MMIKVVGFCILMQVVAHSYGCDLGSFGIKFLDKFDCFENEGKYVFVYDLTSDPACEIISSTVRDGEKAVVCTEGLIYENKDKCDDAMWACFAK